MLTITIVMVTGYHVQSLLNCLLNFLTVVVVGGILKFLMRAGNAESNWVNMLVWIKQWNTSRMGFDPLKTNTHNNVESMQIFGSHKNWLTKLLFRLKWCSYTVIDYYKKYEASLKQSIYLHSIVSPLLHTYIHI